MRLPKAALKLPNQRVLVIGDDTRSFLAVVRSLSRRGIAVEVAPINRMSPALSSRHISNIHYLPPYLGTGERWLAAIENLLDRERFDLVIPMDDRSIVPFHLHRSAFNPVHRVAIPSELAFEYMFSKDRTRELAASLGIPVAQGRRRREGDTIHTILSEFGLPLLLKPLRSFSLHSLYVKSLVRKVETNEQLQHYLSGEFSQQEFIIETHFPGSGLGVSVLANNGNIVQAFEHHRIHEPPGGGGSSYRVSAPLQPELREACENFAAALQYTGVAMFEFRQNFSNGAWILIEVNGRFWGSLPLAIAAGVDFPALLFDLLVLDKVPELSPYRTGIYSRSIGDDYWYYRALLSDCRRGSWGNLCPLLMETIRDLKHVLCGVERIDTLAMDDLRPALREISGLLQLPFTRLSRKILQHSQTFRLQQRRGIRRALQSGKAKGTIKLLFVCKGNICRSPFAAAVGRNILPNFVICEAAGILAMEGRASPPEAIACGSELGFELGEHRSRVIDDVVLPLYDLILTFDLENLAYLRANYPSRRDRIFLLGAYGGRGMSSEIRDPFGGNCQVFRQCYERIRNAVAALRDDI